MIDIQTKIFNLEKEILETRRLVTDAVQEAKKLEKSNCANLLASLKFTDEIKDLQLELTKLSSYLEFKTLKLGVKFAEVWNRDLLAITLEERTQLVNQIVQTKQELGPLQVAERTSEESLAKVEETEKKLKLAGVENYVNINLYDQMVLLKKNDCVTETFPWMPKWLFPFVFLYMRHFGASFGITCLFAYILALHLMLWNLIRDDL
uniref:Uncharacterized protein n=1 Tax=Caenorhabditis japonica TaxID=281687 RepID=A0A8R1HTX1_CAEJA